MECSRNDSTVAVQLEADRNGHSTSPSYQEKVSLDDKKSRNEPFRVKLEECRKVVGSLPLTADADLSEATKYFHSSDAEATGISALAALASSPSANSASSSLASTPIRAMKEMSIQEPHTNRHGTRKKLFADELDSKSDNTTKPCEGLKSSWPSKEKRECKAGEESSSFQGSFQKDFGEKWNTVTKIRGLHRRSTDSVMSLKANSIRDPVVPSNVTRNENSLVFLPPREKERKTCKCKNSMCLKLYCECFAAGQLCSGCSCTNCLNDKFHQKEVLEARNAILLRNPTAFGPKMTAVPREDGAVAIKHQKGCNCKRSNCLKNYCECFHAGVFCSSLCKCTDCKNLEDLQETGLEKSFLDLSHTFSDSTLEGRMKSPRPNNTDSERLSLQSRTSPVDSPRKRWREYSTVSAPEQNQFRKSRSLTYFDSDFVDSRNWEMNSDTLTLLKVVEVEKKKLMQEELLKSDLEVKEDSTVVDSSCSRKDNGSRLAKQDPLICDEKSIVERKSPVIHSLYGNSSGKSRLHIPLFSHLLKTKKKSSNSYFTESNKHLEGSNGMETSNE
eukprot:jgi/Galph1/1874/GphlegSOOS_G558.1